jgi:hypothetical protein
MVKDLIGQLVFVAVKAAAPIIRKKIEDEYAKIKEKTGATEPIYDDVAVYVLGVALGIEK